MTAKAADNYTAVLADEEHGIIRIMIRGKEAARFNAEGLQVRESIEYGGTLMDAGTQHYDDYDKRTGATGAH